MLDGPAKVAMLRDYREKSSGLAVLIETGLWRGRGSGSDLRGCFQRRIVVDIQVANCVLAEADYDLVLCGDSGEQLREYLLNAESLCYVDEPALFWLDAHYNAGIDDPATIDEFPAPLLRELAAILAWPHAAESVVLVDDTYLFGTEGFPTAGEVFELVYNKVWPTVLVRDGILRLLPW